MKPRRLEMEGLRSYRQKQVIDFEPEGLLVITGATGAGKSSILEAMMFALYGVYSGNSKSNKELIADRSDEMRVTLEFEVNGKVYTAHRAVGRKGAGSFALAQGETVLCHDGNRMTAEVTALIGLDEEQFKKTVFLPQGAFQNFLTSKPKERVELLKRLLQVEPLDQLETKVQEWHSQVRQVLDRAEGSRSRYPADPALKVAQLQQAQQEAEQQEAFRQGHYQALELLRQQLQQARTLDKQLLQQHALLGSFQTLKDFDEAAIGVARGQLEQERAELDACLQEQTRQLEDWSQQAPPYQAADLQLARRDRAEIQRLHEDCSRVEQELLRLTQECRELEQRSAQLEEQRRELQNTDLQPRLQSHQRHHRQLQQQLQEQLRRQQQQQQLQEQLARQQLVLQQSQGLLGQAQLRLEEARLRWHEGELHRICGQHRPGQPCPVCSQPLPQEWQPPAPPQHDSLPAAEAGWQEAQAAWQQAEARLSATLQQLTQTHDVQLVDPAELAEAEKLLQELEIQSAEQLRQLARLEGEGKALARALAQDRRPALEEQLVRQRQKAAELEANQRFAGQDLDELEQLRARWEEQNLALRRTQLETRSRWQEWQQRWDRQVEEPTRQLQFLRQQCAQALQLDFSTPHQDLLDQLETRVKTLEEQLRSSQTYQQEVEQHFQSKLEETGLPAWEAAQAWLRSAQDASSRARHEVENATRQLREVQELEALLVPARAHLDKLAALVRLLGHQRAKGTKMTFPQWYMQQRQGELLQLASHHLELLSGGQFRFEEDLDDAQSFRVLDLFSGVPRAVTTLSGGETFLASLSLAVALAELVGRRGGQLQALFLDEGFGTLSAECLDRALTALEQLADQGRLIGIISHVPLIAERIEQVWWVRKSPGGSQIVKADEHMRAELLRQELASFDPRMHPLFS